jgi:uracil-DNA glycosylase
VPWYLGDRGRIRAPKSEDLLEARRYIEQLISLLPKVQVVVLLGKHAQTGWDRLALSLQALAAPHPSPTNLNTRPHLRGELLDTLRKARRVAYGD